MPEPEKETGKPAATERDTVIVLDEARGLDVEFPPQLWAPIQESAEVAKSATHRRKKKKSDTTDCDRAIHAEENINEVSKSALLVTLFILLSDVIAGSKVLFVRLLGPILLPMIPILEGITAFLAGLRLFRADNRNAGKTFDFVFALSSTALFATAVGIFAVFPGVAAGLVIAPAAAGTLYYAAQSIYHLYLGFTANDPTKKEFFFSKSKDYAIRGLFGLGTTAALVVLMVVLPIVPIAWPVIVAGVVLAVSLVVTACAYAIYRRSHPIAPPEVTDKTSEERGLLSDRVTPAADNELTPKENAPKGSILRYYSTKERVAQLTNDPDANRHYLLREGVDKIDSLQEEIAQDNGTCSGFCQNRKRIEKINFVAKDLAELLPFDQGQQEDVLVNALAVLSDAIGEDRVYDHLNNSSESGSRRLHHAASCIMNQFVEQRQAITGEVHAPSSPPLRKPGLAFQSFFRLRGDTEDFHRAVLRAQEIEKENLKPHVEYSRYNYSTLVY